MKYKGREKTYRREYYHKKKDQWKEGNKNRRDKYRKLVFDYYGNRCSCCEETEPLFLTIDHVNNNGNIERTHGLTGAHLYSKIIKEGFPDTYRILCWNCNCGRERNHGVCPHERLKEGEK